MRANCSTWRGGQQAAGDLAAHHLDAGLALAVDAVFEAEGAELVFGDLAGQEGLGLGAEGFDLFPDGSIMLILKLFPLGEDFLGGGCHNHLT